MLLFIDWQDCILRSETEFKYISCYCLSRRTFRRSILPHIQIHLMLLFIRTPQSARGRNMDSNTSHVIVYPWSPWKGYACKTYSNTSHVIVYQMGISQQLLQKRYSNTSHVIVYPHALFQILSCASYSNTSHVIVYRRSKGGGIVRYTYSNTSHVIVYLTCEINGAWELTNSNTSHVIVYLSLAAPGQGPLYIQIHLMLLFIADVKLINLSIRPIQIHLMLLFIYSSVTSRYSAISIQIHLMLLFIHGVSSYVTYNLNSNTSHVIVYRGRPTYSPCRTEFKYISCYCLSYRILQINELVRGFKYISCYCLSACRFLTTQEKNDSNTSHVIVYR